MSVRFTEDLDFRAPNARQPIHVVGVLRQHLGVPDEPKDVVVKAIREWLKLNAASSALIRDLKRSEFAVVLDRANA
ncbi:hypothetical protein [Nakamurella multipartita]|uniref:Uncharacterized protein n=1 Tax=Nakamurella multipartita (strain ATCC 700099 / DSM 44233 / CIP 104796 / JCM 9543 / NBRC 105858 / Y-104) TaxID=479431 RepID=C8X6P3_NAKMY|nr:hypothetical protein [Nakamurella multipartita]ACV80791.1 hypothetical protein Namu_4512 [Nakamurella multipartita DSM 44233]